MAYTRHLTLTPVTEPRHRQLISDHYRIDPDDFAALYCAMGGSPDDVVAPREVLIVTHEEKARYQRRLERYEASRGEALDTDRPELLVRWLVRRGRIQPDLSKADPFTLTAANKRLAYLYQCSRALNVDSIEVALIERTARLVITEMRRNWIGNGVVRMTHETVAGGVVRHFSAAGITGPEQRVPNSLRTLLIVLGDAIAQARASSRVVVGARPSASASCFLSV